MIDFVYILQAFVTFVLGAVIGSFLLVVASRMNVRTLRGRSKCDACGTQLRARDLIPVVSYLALGGRCRDCQTRISPVALWTECVMGAGFAIHSFVAYDIVTLLIGYVALSLCCVMALYDSKYHLLPSAYLWLLIGVGLIYRYSAPVIIGVNSGWEGLLYMAVPALLLGGLVVFSKGRLMGAGDPLLLFGLSLYIGTWQGALMTLLLASWLGILYVVIVGVAERISGQKNALAGRRIAFGPSLVVGFFITWWLTLSGVGLFV